jgi:23S rRNA (cytidine1920-2'-O)/16S rRNA (cytidine1409-2'-O)-methyltransferase
LTLTRIEARDLIESDRVVVRGMPTPKPASLVGSDTPIEILSEDRKWVSRGAHKLLAALEAFSISVDGMSALDIGSSTGGFTEVLLDRGATKVVALDVGRAQLHESLQSDPRVVSREKTNFRLVDVAAIGGPFDLVVGDLSFISLCAVAGRIAEAASSGAEVVLLVKPQFEAPREQVGSGGIVTDAATRRQTVLDVIRCLDEVGLGAMGVIRSPIKGRDGNVEYLLFLRRGEPGLALEVPD